MRGPVTDLTAAMLIAWAKVGANDSKGAVESLDKLTGADWYALFKDLHTGLIYDATGNRKEAQKRLERAYKLDNGALRVVQSYASVLVRQGQKDDALKVLETFDKALPRHPLVTGELEKVRAGEKLPPLIDNAQAGAAEALVRPRRGARPARRRRSRPRLSAACPLSHAAAPACAAFACRPL